jgi:hypothetical protein
VRLARHCEKPALGFHTDALLFRLLVALPGGRDLLLCAKHLSVAAKGCGGEGLQSSGGLAGAPRYGLGGSKHVIPLR